MTDNNKAQSDVLSLKQVYGDFVDLEGEDGTSEAYQILAELTVNAIRYAVLQSEVMKQEDEIEVFRVVEETQGEIGLESITDEDEWELVAEAFDDIQFGSDDQP
jgi:uncharacterized protein YrzB (UPF0473 family)